QYADPGEHMVRPYIVRHPLILSSAVRRHRDVVHVDAEHALRREAEQSRRTLRMDIPVGNLDRPGIRLRIAALPGFRSYYSRAIGRDVDPRFEVVPGAGSPPERRRRLDPFLVGAHLQLLGVADEG